MFIKLLHSLQLKGNYSHSIQIWQKLIDLHFVFIKSSLFDLPSLWSEPVWVLFFDYVIINFIATCAEFLRIPRTKTGVSMRLCFRYQQRINHSEMIRMRFIYHDRLHSDRSLKLPGKLRVINIQCTKISLYDTDDFIMRKAFFVILSGKEFVLQIIILRILFNDVMILLLWTQLAALQRNVIQNTAYRFAG